MKINGSAYFDSFLLHTKEFGRSVIYEDKENIVLYEDIANVNSIFVYLKMFTFQNCNNTHVFDIT